MGDMADYTNSRLVVPSKNRQLQERRESAKHNKQPAWKPSFRVNIDKDNEGLIGS